MPTTLLELFVVDVLGLELERLGGVRTLSRDDVARFLCRSGLTLRVA